MTVKPTLRLVALTALGSLIWIPGWFAAGIALSIVTVTLAAVDVALALWLIRRIRVVRSLPPVLELESRQEVCLIVSNLGFVRASVLLKDDPPEGVRWELDGGKFEDLRPVVKTFISPFIQKALTYTLVPLRRGEFTFRHLIVAVRTPLGLIEAIETRKEAQRFTVLPNLAAARRWEWMMRKRQMSQFGARTYLVTGAGSEFASLRDYFPDDDPRWIDWNATARRGRLVSKEFQWERGRNIVGVLDAGRVMATPLDGLTKLDVAVNACAFLLYLARHLDDRIGLLVFRQAVERWLPPQRGIRQWETCLKVLRQVQPELVESDYRRALTYLGNQITRRSFVVLFSDLTDPDSSESLMSYCSVLAEKHQVLLVAVSDYEYEQLLEDPPATADELYRKGAAIALLNERLKATLVLKNRGVEVIDTSPEQLFTALIRYYLTVKRRL